MIKLIKNYMSAQKKTCEIRSDALDELREVTARISWKPKYRGNGDRVVKVDAMSGASTLMGLHNTPELAVSVTQAEAGCVYDWHSHDETEYFIMQSGRMDIELKDMGVTYLLPKDHFSIPPGVEHKVIFPIDSVFLAVTIPAAPNFPSGGRFSDADEFTAATKR